MIYEFLKKLQWELIDHEVADIHIKCHDWHKDFEIKFIFIECQCTLNITDGKDTIHMELQIINDEIKQELVDIINHILKQLDFKYTEVSHDSQH